MQQSDRHQMPCDVCQMPCHVCQMPCGVCQIPYATWPTLCCVADPAVCTMYGFREEVASKYDMGLFALFSEAFAALPLVTVIEDTAVVLHGGPTRHPTEPGRPQTLHEIDALDRFVQDVRMPSPASHASLNLSGMCAPHSPSQVYGKTELEDILWCPAWHAYHAFECLAYRVCPVHVLCMPCGLSCSQGGPQAPSNTCSPSRWTPGSRLPIARSDPEQEVTGPWEESYRGAGVLYGFGFAQEFLRQCGLSVLIRSHEMVEHG